MAKGIFSVGLIAFLLLALGYQRFKTSVEESPRQVVDAGIKSAKEGRSLSQDEEQYLRVQLALVDFQSKAGKSPMTLSELIPTYFDSVPLDPKTNQPYSYRREGSNFVLEAPGQTAVAKADEAGKMGGAEIKGVKPGDLSVTPAINEEDDFIYDATDKRDPFRPFDLSPKYAANVLPLERYNLAQLRLTATAKDGTGNPTALLEDEAGKGFTVKVGGKVGNNNGVVIDIQPNMMKVLERKVDFAGVESENVVEIKIQARVDDKKKNNNRPKKRRP